MPRFSFSAAFDRAALACAICLAALPVLTVVAGASILSASASPHRHGGRP